MEEAQKVTGITAGKGNEPVWLQWPPQPERKGTDRDCLLTITQPAEMVVKVRRRFLTAPTPQHGARPPQSQRGSPRGLAVYVTQGTHPFGAASCEKPAPSISCHRSSPGAPQSTARTLLFSLLPPNTPLVSPKKINQTNPQIHGHHGALPALPARTSAKREPRRASPRPSPLEAPGSP